LFKKKYLSSIIALVLCLALCLTTVYRETISDFYDFSKAALSYYGSHGQEVIDVQSKLYNWGYYNDIVDGIYGYNTYKAVTYFQSKNGLSVDGIAGPETLAALGLPTGETTVSTKNNYSNSGDTQLLARLIHGEARGESYTGKVAVGAVILNRTRDGRFPKTIAGVIYEPGAFDAVNDGQINLEPDPESVKAASDALNGWDPTYGCVFYWNPATATSKWIWSRKIVVTIGKHVFGI
jgi:N-acetylmuramoyl-L-alanine amidase